MKLFPYQLIFFLFVQSLSFGQTKDTLGFKNKALIIGELKSIALGKIEFDADGLGIVKIKNDKIQSIKAVNHSYRIELVGGQLLFGKLDFHTRQGYCWVLQDEIKTEIEINTIVNLSLVGNDFKTKLTGEIGAGYSYSKSSNIGRLNFNTHLNHLNKKTEFDFLGNTIITFDEGKTFRERENLQSSSFYLFNSKWYSGLLLGYQRNLGLGLESRWQEGLGFGYKFLQKQNHQAKFLSGIVVDQERNFDLIKNNFTEVLVKLNYDFFTFNNPEMSLSMNQIFFVGLTDGKRLRHDSEISFEIELIDDFTIKLDWYYNLDTKSPEDFKRKTDYGIVTGLSYEF